MGALKAIGKFLSGSFVKNSLEFINKRWPADMSEQQRAEMEIVIKEMLHRQQMQLSDAARQDEQLFNERTIALEGTAKDLASIPYLGAPIIFLRGAFRPLFAYMVAYFDYEYLISGMTWSDRQETLLLAINLLVLVFFFGERAMKNVMPLIMGVFVAKKEQT